MKLAVDKKHLDDGKELKTLVASAVAKALKMKKNSKAGAIYNSNLEDELEHFNFKNIDILVEYDLELEKICNERLTMAKLCVKGTRAQKQLFYQSKIVNSTKKKNIYNTQFYYGEK